MQDEPDQIKILRAFEHLYGYTRKSVQSAIEEIRTADHDESVKNLMLQRADELADYLDIVSDHVQSQ